MQAAPGQLGWVVNHQKIKRLMRGHGLQPPHCRRLVVMPSSDHDQPVLSGRARELVIAGPNQLRPAGQAWGASGAGFVEVAVIMDAWSRRIVGP